MPFLCRVSLIVLELLKQLFLYGFVGFLMAIAAGNKAVVFSYVRRSPETWKKDADEVQWTSNCIQFVEG